MDNERAAIRSGLIEKGVFRVTVDRLKVVPTVVSAYTLNPRIHEMEMKVKFGTERGMDIGGLRRELVNRFWDEFETTMVGNQEKVPQVLPTNQCDYYHIGRFLSHAYVMTGFFPVNHLSSICAKVILCGYDSISQSELVAAFYRYVDRFEAEALQASTADGRGDLMKSVVTPMLSRFQVFSLPSEDNLSDLIAKAARYAFVAKPYYALSEVRRGMLDAHPELWTRCSPSIVEALYDMLTPTVTRVWAMVEEPALSTPSEDMTFDYLRRFIHSLSAECLVKFLCFVTGFSVCTSKSIAVQFNAQEGLLRRPTSNTCAMILHLPVTYESYASFCSEFQSVLHNSNMWFFDAL